MARQFEDLQVYKDSMRVTQELYKLTLSGHFQKDYAFCEQFKRPLLSVTSNIAEGFERNSNRELRRFLLIAKGSAGEVRSQLLFATAIGYFAPEISDSYRKELLNLSMQLKGFVKYLQTWKEAQRPDGAPTF